MKLHFIQQKIRKRVLFLKDLTEQKSEVEICHCPTLYLNEKLF